MIMLNEHLHAKIEPLELPLAAPLQVGKIKLQARNLVGVTLHHQDKSGRGEAAPLPNYSDEDFGQTIRSLEEACAELKGRMNETLRKPEDFLARVSVPSARFALEQALVALRGEIENEPLHRAWQLYLGQTNTSEHVKLSALVYDFEVSTTQKLLEMGYRVLKLKVRPGDFSRIQALVERFPQARFRLDANQGLGVAEAKAYERLPLDAFEEPVAVDELPLLADSALPVYLDESLRGPFAEELVQLDCVRGLVLKPTTLGGGMACLDWAKMARARGLETVITHCFDGFISHRATCFVAAVLGSGHHGLANHACLDAWFAKHGLDPMVSGPSLPLSALEAVNVGS